MFPVCIFVKVSDKDGGGPKAIPLTRIHKCNQLENLPPACEEGLRLSQSLKAGPAQCPQYVQSAKCEILTPLQSAAKFP